MDVRLNRFIDMEWEKLAASFGWFQAEGLPELEQASGFRTIFFGVDPTRGRAAGVTFWNDDIALSRSEPVEERLRNEALRRAGAELSQGLVDRYRLAIDIGGDANATYARLTRWEGLTDARLQAGYELFRDQLVPACQMIPGFSGIFVGLNKPQGKVLGVFLWDSPESMKASFEWELEARAGVESQTGPQRSVIVETYQVALAPEHEAGPATARP